MINILKDVYANNLSCMRHDVQLGLSMSDEETVSILELADFICPNIHKK